MNISRNIISSAILLGFSSLSTVVYADGYWGFGAGNASINLKPLYGTEKLEDSAMLQLIIGNRTDNFAFEINISAGVFDWEYSSVNSHAVAVVSANALGFLPVSDRFELFAKLGANYSNTAVDYYGGTYEGDVGFGISYGAGAMLNLTERFSLRAEYQGLTGIDDGVDSGDLDWVSLQAIFSF